MFTLAKLIFLTPLPVSNTRSVEQVEILEIEHLGSSCILVKTNRHIICDERTVVWGLGREKTRLLHIRGIVHEPWVRRRRGWRDVRALLSGATVKPAQLLTARLKAVRWWSELEVRTTRIDARRQVTSYGNVIHYWSQAETDELLKSSRVNQRFHERSTTSYLL